MIDKQKQNDMLTLEKLREHLKVCDNADDRTVIKSFITTIEGYMQKGWLLNRERLSVKSMLRKLQIRKVIDVKMYALLEMSLKSEKIKIHGYKTIGGDYEVSILGEDDIDLGTIKVTTKDLKEHYDEWDGKPCDYFDYILDEHLEHDLIQEFLNY